MAAGTYATHSEWTSSGQLQGGKDICEEGCDRSSGKNGTKKEGKHDEGCENGNVATVRAGYETVDGAEKRA